LSQFKILFLQNEQDDPDKLKKDDRRKVENTMVGLIIMNWMREQLPDLSAKYGKSFSDSTRF
jgi:hypothetical protein